MTYYGRYSAKGKWHILDEKKEKICFTKVAISDIREPSDEKPENICKRCINKEKGGSEKKRNFSKAVRDHLWDIRHGKSVGEAPCYVCLRTINSKHFDAGHKIAFANGGLAILQNAECICSPCNKSMGTQDMDVYKNKHYPSQKPQLVKTV